MEFPDIIPYKGKNILRIPFKGKNIWLNITYNDIGRGKEPIETFFDELEIKEKYLNLSGEDFFVDVGAAYGSYTILALMQKAKVLAFEPNPTIYMLLCVNIMDNMPLYPDLSLKTLRVVNAGLSDTQEILGYNNMYQTTYLDADTRIECKPLDLFLNENKTIISKITLIKIDTEGMEYKVLIGAKHTIARDKPRLLIEIHDNVPWLADKLKGNKQRVIEFLKEYNYVIEEIPYKGREFIYAYSNSL